MTFRPECDILLRYSYPMIADNLKSVTQRVSRSCEKSGRRPDDVKLICVTKQADISQINEVLALGVKEIGENRLSDALIKYKSIGDRAVWHLIGHLQTNKVKDAVKIFSLIHSVDSVRLAKKIDKEAKKINKVQDILIEVNASGEQSKFGILPANLEILYKDIVLYPNINILGLMTMAPEVDDPEEARQYFRKLREIRDKFNAIRNTPWPASSKNQGRQYAIRELSMGMTNDFEVAIEEGATMVRIGRAIFKDDR